MCLGAGLVGWIALSPLGSPAWIMFLALAWGNARTRGAAFCVGFSYSFALAFTLPQAMMNFAPSLSPFAAALALPTMAAISGLAFAACWAPSSRGEAYRIASALTLLLVLAVPPLGAVFWGHPILATAELFPGMGVAGIAAAILLWAALASLRLRGMDTEASTASAATSDELVASIIGLALVSSVVHLQADLMTDDTKPLASTGSSVVVGVDFAMGRMPIDQVNQYAYLSLEVAPTLRAMHLPAGSIALLPESVGGVTSSARLQWWHHELADFFAEQGTLILGEWDLHGKGIGVISGQRYRYYPARQSTPWTEWQWSNDYPSFGMFSNVVELGDGKRYALINCYEAAIAWPIFLDLLRQPDAILFASNQFWARDNRGGEAIDASITAWGRIAGVPVVRAINR